MHLNHYNAIEISKIKYLCYSMKAILVPYNSMTEACEDSLYTCEALNNVELLKFKDCITCY